MSCLFCGPDIVNLFICNICAGGTISLSHLCKSDTKTLCPLEIRLSYLVHPRLSVLVRSDDVRKKQRKDKLYKAKVRSLNCKPQLE